MENSKAGKHDKKKERTSTGLMSLSVFLDPLPGDVQQKRQYWLCQCVEFYVNNVVYLD